MSIPAAVFKAECLKLMDEVARSGRPVVIAKRGRPVAQLGPVPAAPTSSFGYMKNTVSIKDDVIAPSGGRWGIDSANEYQLQTVARRRPRTRRAGSKK